MKSFVKILIALMLGLSVIFTTVACESTSSETDIEDEEDEEDEDEKDDKKKDKDEDEDDEEDEGEEPADEESADEEPVEEEPEEEPVEEDEPEEEPEEDEHEELDLYELYLASYDEAPLAELLGCVKDMLEMIGAEVDEYEVKAVKGWRESDELDEDDDLSDGAEAYTYSVSINASYEGETAEAKMYLFVELVDGKLQLVGSKEEADGEEEENGYDGAVEFVDSLVEMYGFDINDYINDYEDEYEDEDYEDDYDYSYSDEEVPENIKAYGDFEFGMSMEDAAAVIDYEYEIDEEFDTIDIEDYDDEFDNEDEEITGSVNCETMYLWFENDVLFSVDMTTSNISEDEANEVFECLENYFGSDYEYDGEYEAYTWTLEDNTEVYASMTDFGDGEFYWSIEIENFDYFI